jgi:hypothetical protein
MLLMNAVTARRAHFIDLCVVELIVGRNAGIAAAYSGMPRR